MVVIDKPTKAEGQVVHTRESFNEDRAMDDLSKMPLNRRLEQKRVELYASDMTNGDFNDDTCDAILYDWEGNLINGQHRLWAIIESRTTHTFAVVRGLPSEAILILDQGKPRHHADYLHLRREKNSTALASAVQLIAIYTQTGVLARSSIQKTPPISSLDRFLEANPGIRDAVASGRSADLFFGGGGRWASSYYILSSINDDDAKFFFGRLVDGVNLEANNAIYALRKRLIENKTSIKKLREIEVTAMIFKAWNNYREGKPASRVTWRRGGADPETYPEPI